MPQPKRSSTTRGGSRKPARGTPTAEDDASPGLREQLARLLNPLDAVVLTRERLQEVVDDAVQRGRMTHSDATDLVTEILARGRRTTEDLFSDRVRREVDRARRVTGIGSAFPITGYENLTAAQVHSRLGGLSPAELRKVRDYERRNANRKTVLSAIESKLA